MANTQLTSYLLDQSLLDYTVEATRNALSNSSASDVEVPRKRARLALEFFVSLLDPTVDSEKAQQETFKKYLIALDDEKLASQVASSLPSAASTSTKSLTSFSLNSAQTVLALPDTVGEILSHISPLTQEGRSTLHAVSSVSRSFHNIADRTLWHVPRDLNTVEQQVRFAFGASISGALSDPLGSQVKGLRIRRMAGGWNDRLIVKIAQLCPSLESLLLHCGDTGQEDPVTPAFLTTIYTTLSSLPNLKDLSLIKYSYTAELPELPPLADDAYIPFTKLTSLRLYDFGWYLPAIFKGLGKSLQSLEIDMLPALTSEQFITLAKQTTSLTSLSISCDVEVEPLREFVASSPSLTRVTLKQYNGHDNKYAKEFTELVTKNLPGLTEFSLGGVPVGHEEVTMLTQFKGPIESLSLLIQDGITLEDCSKMLAGLVKSKKDTLKVIEASYELSSTKLSPSEELISALAGCSQLEDILILFDSPTGLPVGFVDSLLKGCPKLQLSWSLETLVEGNELYEKEYKIKMEKAEEARLAAEEDTALGN